MATAQEMANWIVMWGDAIMLEGASIHANSPAADTDYPASNLLDDNRQTLMKFAGSGYPQTCTVDFDLGASTDIYAFSIHNHNGDSKGSGTVSCYYSDNGADWYLAALAGSFVSDLADEDYFGVLTSQPSSHRYWRISFTSVDSAGLYIGRVGLWENIYDLAKRPLIGATKGFYHRETVNETLGGVELRVSHGPLRRRIQGMIANSSDTQRGELNDLIEAITLNDAAFCTNSPFGTTELTSYNRRGAAIHARFRPEEWLYALKVRDLSDIPIDIIEVL